jgi:glycosyltransferase involved in cell wall biosynthesis
LNSIDFAQEIILVDSESTDGTVELARAAGATIIETADWPGFGPQKNRALAAATGDGYSRSMLTNESRLDDTSGNATCYPFV